MSESRWAAISADAIDDRTLTLTDFRVLGCIGYHQDRNRGAWPKQQTIADRLGVTREAVNRSVKRLTEKGYIRAIGQFRKGGGKRESRYFVILDPKEAALPLVGEDEADTPPAPGDVIARSHRDVISEITGDVISKVTSTKEEHTNKNTPPNPQGLGVESEKSSDLFEAKVEDAFERLWTAWPAKARKRGASRAHCREAFAEACTRHDPDAIARAGVVFLRETDPNFAPGLPKWLTAGQFEHFINTPTSVINEPATHRAGLAAPTSGRAGACYRALVERFGVTKTDAWLRGAQWGEAEILLESDYARMRVESDFGGILRLFEIEAKVA